MNKKFFFLALGLGFASAFMLMGLCACNRKSDSLAIVNGEPISMTEYYEYLQNKPDVTVVTENGKIALPVDGSLGFQATRDLIGHQLELQIAKEKNCYPTSTQVDQELQIKLKQNPNYLQDLMLAGVTLDVIRKNITLDLSQECLQTHGIHVTTEDAKKYIKDNPKEFVEPAKVQLMLIYVKDDSGKQKVDSALASGQSFASVALSLSEAPTAHKYNGYLTDPNAGPVTKAALAPPILEAIKNLKEQHMTDWIQFSNGWAKFYLDKDIPEQPIVMDAAKIDLVRRELAKREGAQKNNVQDMILKKLKDSKIEVVLPTYRDPWKNAMDQLKTEG